MLHGGRYDTNVTHNTTRGWGSTSRECPLLLVINCPMEQGLCSWVRVRHRRTLSTLVESLAVSEPRTKATLPMSGRRSSLELGHHRQYAARTVVHFQAPFGFRLAISAVVDIDLASHSRKTFEILFSRPTDNEGRRINRHTRRIQHWSG